jgi:hypothetical protein
MCYFVGENSISGSPAARDAGGIGRVRRLSQSVFFSMDYKTVQKKTSFSVFACEALAKWPVVVIFIF